jgi:hypothetical protein
MTSVCGLSAVTENIRLGADIAARRKTRYPGLSHFDTTTDILPACFIPIATELPNAFSMFTLIPYERHLKYCGIAFSILPGIAGA